MQCIAGTTIILAELDELSIIRSLCFPFTLHALTINCPHLKETSSPCLSENEFALMVSGRSTRFLITVPVKLVKPVPESEVCSCSINQCIGGGCYQGNAA